MNYPIDDTNGQRKQNHNTILRNNDYPRNAIADSWR